MFKKLHYWRLNFLRNILTLSNKYPSKPFGDDHTKNLTVCSISYFLRISRTSSIDLHWLLWEFKSKQWVNQVLSFLFGNNRVQIYNWCNCFKKGQGVIIISPWSKKPSPWSIWYITHLALLLHSCSWFRDNFLLPHSNDINLSSLFGGSHSVLRRSLIALHL